MPEFTHEMVSLSAAIATGLLIGFERGWSQRELGPGHRVAGFRTFGLLGFIGGLAGFMPDIVAAVVVLGVAATLVFGYVRKARDEDRLSATTTIAGMLTLAIGMAAVRLSPSIALASAAVAVMLLSARHSMHALLRGFNAEEVDAIARFALVALVVLPLLPDASYGPYDAWNPRRIWLVVVFVTALSLAGYVIARRFGSKRSILFLSLTGSLVSSTAVTADCARRLRREPEARGALIAGIALATLVMFLRVQLLVFVLVPRALPSMALALSPAVTVAALIALVAWRQQSRQEGTPLNLGNPFDFGPALFLAGLVAVFSLAGRWALARFGEHGIAVVLGLTGILDADTGILTLSGMPKAGLSDVAAGLVLVVPVLTNTAVKAVIALALAPGRDRLRAAMPLLSALSASLVGLLVYWLV